MAEQRRSRAFSLVQLGEGSDKKEPQGEGENSLTSGAQELEPQQKAEAVVEPKPYSEQGLHGEVEKQEW